MRWLKQRDSAENRPMTTDQMPEEATVADQQPTVPVPSLYPLPAWADDPESPWWVEPSLRAAYASAVNDPATVGRIMAEAESGKRGRPEWVTFAEADRLQESGQRISRFSEPISDDNRRIQVLLRMTGAEALHRARLAQAKKATAPPSPAVAPVTLVCAGCGATEQTSAVGVVHADIKRHTTGLPFRLGLGDVLLCPRCESSLPAVVAAEEVRPGVTRAEALAALVQPSRAEQDQALAAMVAERA